MVYRRKVNKSTVRWGVVTIYTKMEKIIIIMIKFYIFCALRINGKTSGVNTLFDLLSQKCMLSSRKPNYIFKMKCSLV